MSLSLWVLLLVASPEAARHEAAGVKHLMAGRLDDAKRELQTCVEVDPDAASCHRSLGVLYAQLDDPKRSIHHYRRYVTLDPHADDATRVRQIIKDATGETIAAPPARRAAPPPEPTKHMVPKRLVRLARRVGEEGQKALGAGERPRAETLLLACVELNPGSAGCHRSLGVLYAQKDEADLALKHYRRYVEISPNSPDAAQVRRMLKDSGRRR